MTIQQTQNDTLEVRDLEELSAAVAASVRDAIKGQLGENHRTLRIDLSQTAFVDSSGLGVLVSLHKALVARGGVLQLVSPSAVCRQILELTRLHRILPIIS